ncbi:ArsR/SmtB family transcription factor [Caulobacter mirabilis]|uniref:Transcriptional regulator n=1 Tax=Caulobacter mirabilis TaxID=69666 RepID=A0A2D2AW39_9CAUL|nr:helix-turn-helix domain-containing protein [Caulobacter mirabilis]ATQ42185.1 transcriptional regulator [Caulobacter mirabilis]
MSGPTIALLQDADRLRTALSPVRRALLEQLQTPASASQLAETLGMSRQKLNYHLRALEAAGLIHLVEERRRRGFVERVLAATADRLVVDPALLAPTEPEQAAAQDRYAAGHLVAAATGVVRDVARMQSAAELEGSRLLTFTLEAEIAFARPADLERFAEALAEALASTAARFHSADPGARRYRLVAGGHPAPVPAGTEH